MLAARVLHGQLCWIRMAKSLPMLQVRQSSASSAVDADPLRLSRGDQDVPRHRRPPYIRAID